MPSHPSALSPRTAERLLRLLADQGISEPIPRHPARGRSAALVRCTSTTAAATTGVGAQCYPGVVLLPRADDTNPTELDGLVWITIWNSSGGADVPDLDQVYTAVLGGFIDPSGGSDATGYRQRANVSPSGGLPPGYNNFISGSALAFPDSTWVTVGSVELPANGDYVVHVAGEVRAQVSSPSADGYVYSRLYNATDGLAFDETWTIATASPGVPLRYLYSQTFYASIDSGAPKTAEWQISRSTLSFGTWVLAEITTQGRMIWQRVQPYVY